MTNLKTDIAYGQPYVDEPVFVEVSKARPLAFEIHYLPWTVPSGHPLKHRIETLSHYERVRLRWMVPDGEGGVVPKFKRDQV